MELERPFKLKLLMWSILVASLYNWIRLEVFMSVNTLASCYQKKKIMARPSTITVYESKAQSWISDRGVNIANTSLGCIYNMQCLSFLSEGRLGRDHCECARWRTCLCCLYWVRRTAQPPVYPPHPNLPPPYHHRRGNTVGANQSNDPQSSLLERLGQPPISDRRFLVVASVCICISMY